MSIPKENFESFVARRRFNPREIFTSNSTVMTSQVSRLVKCFPDFDRVIFWAEGRQLAEFNRALAVASYMANSDMDKPEGFAVITSMLQEDSWNYSLRFSPYHKVHTALENLERVHAAMLEASFSLNAATAGMESALELKRSDNSAYTREQSKATSSLLTFSALYASYIDVCRRIRKYTKMENSNAYQRGIRRVIGKNFGAHCFVTGLRNYILHYNLVEPNIIVSIGEKTTVQLLLDSNSLFLDGYKWTADARDYIHSDKKLDVLQTTNTVVKDVARLVRFHRKIAERRLPKEKLAYDTYLHERTRLIHLQNASFDPSAFIKRHSTVLPRVIAPSVMEVALNSTISDNELRMLLTTLANRHQNLSLDKMAVVVGEIEQILRRRIRYPNTGSYLDGRKTSGATFA